ncbi:PadR family transcriptional regulator [Mycolicibacterium agri]|uniref:Transcriptional regulator n=1 Tax=Mycolicibacterium agri TaxID=36811 RepID=A0A2A7N5E8_MYCAG|nr:PadR family transcriptional regulator [Mycolicibacterium agri]PEG39096.1 PadR family transcriptional regulator [Mycolicibacterium agri]GFG53989.1 transcriptional regulator [Mycolicibacterium agri]
MSLRIAALGLLAKQPGSGYDLLKLFEKSLANVWPATQSQLYGELNKLAESGLIEVSAVGPRGRKEYRITDTGREELQRWVLHPEDDPPQRSSALLRVFLLGEVPPQQARRHMIALAEHSDAEVERLQALNDSLDWDDDASSFFARAALEYGLRVNAMQADWARWVIAELDRRRPAESSGSDMPELAREKT